MKLRAFPNARAEVVRVLIGDIFTSFCMFSILAVLSELLVPGLVSPVADITILLTVLLVLFGITLGTGALRSGMVVVHSHFVLLYGCVGFIMFGLLISLQHSSDLLVLTILSLLISIAIITVHTIDDRRS